MITPLISAKQSLVIVSIHLTVNTGRSAILLPTNVKQSQDTVSIHLIANPGNTVILPLTNVK